MVIDSSRATSPRSRLVTIDSNSLSAASKERLVTSGRAIGSATSASSSRHQLPDMRRSRVRQRLEIVTAFEQRNDAAVRSAVGQAHNLARSPSEVPRVEVDLRQRVAPMRVKAGGNQDHVRGKFLYRREDSL